MNIDSAAPSPLLQNLLLFIRLLRSIGLRVTSGQLIELVGSLEFVDIRSRRDFKNSARCLLVNRREDIPLFDRAFDVFWSAPSLDRRNGPLENLVQDLARQLQRGQPAPKRVESAARDGTIPNFRTGAESSQGAGTDEEGDQEAILAFYSPGEVLRRKDFGRYSEEELADAKRFLATMRWDLTRRRSLRLRASRSGRQMDVRRSIRGSLRHGGELLDLAYRGPKLKRRQLVILCDISGSMERYTRLLLHFVHALGASLRQVEVFVFGTRLTRITTALRRRNPDAALAAVEEQVLDWSGGTRIGESLRAFNRQWARRVLGHGAIVMVISDGWDRGDPEMLTVEMERLRRESYRLIWLNPLLGVESYEPLTQGIQAALPYVDDFLPVHNLASLEALAALLNAVGKGRPPRKQVYHTPGVAP